ncbi:MAG TPA: exonuclease domain-containing protein [Burkholderiales bacterium]
MKIVAIDFETADFGADSACALGIVSIENGNITKATSRLIRPPRKNFVFTYIHGITWDRVKSEANFDDVWEDFRDHWIDADYLVAHNAPFDRKVLFTCCAAAGRQTPSTPFICTVRVARTHWKFKPANLAYVCTQLGIALKHHDAGSDAFACASITARAILEGFPIKAAILGPPSYSMEQA